MPKITYKDVGLKDCMICHMAPWDHAIFFAEQVNGNQEIELSCSPCKQERISALIEKGYIVSSEKLL